MRVELEHVEPAVWRLIEVPSDLTLDRLHDVLQVAMGWTNSHLHQFASGDALYGANPERYLMPSSIDEGMVGIDETRVRLDEVLAEPGDCLWYEYDFGDSWEHRLVLEQVRPHNPEAAPIRCLAGANACPPEDSGGIGGYQHLVEILAGPPGPERDEMITWIGRPFDPAAFDVEAVDAALVGGKRVGLPAVDPVSPLGELLGTMRFGVPAPVVEALQALAEPAPVVSAAERTVAVLAYSRLLDRVGDDGIALTQAGYLPPAHVEELAAELSLDAFWGKNNREVNAVPVLVFRESAQGIGLIRKTRGRLVLTKAGARARRDPDALWTHIAGALPLGGPSRGEERVCAEHAGILLLLAIGAGAGREQRTAIIAAGLAAAGWRDGSGEPIPDRRVLSIGSPTAAVLIHTAVLPDKDGWPPADPPLSPTAIAFARAALGG